MVIKIDKVALQYNLKLMFREAVFKFLKFTKNRKKTFNSETFWYRYHLL